MSDTAAIEEPGARLAFHWQVLLACLAVCGILLAMNWDQVLAFQMDDADDHLRLAQVRDWIAGQSWWDVRQYRFNPPQGGDIHWSRLVDVPLAASILVLTPLLGRALAETVTLAGVPLLLYAGVVTCTAYSARSLMDRHAGVFAALLAATTPLLTHQLSPMRIDHHGWQILMAAVTFLALLTLRGRAAGLAAGVSAAFWVHISMEALPSVALVGALFGIRFIVDPEERPAFAAYLLSVVGASFLFFAATKPASIWSVSYCDAMSWPYLVPLAIMGLLGLIVSMPGAGGGAWSRTALVGGVSGAAGAVFLWAGPNCLAGPFGSLDPLVRELWYLNVVEGLPIWRQEPQLAAILAWTPLVGCLGTYLGWRAAEGPEAKRRWGTAAFLFGGSFALSLLVLRSGAVAHLYALPGCTFLLFLLLKRARPMKNVLVRIPLTAAAIVLPSPTLGLFAAAAVSPEQPATAEPAAVETAPPMAQKYCVGRWGMRGLSTLPATNMLNAIDIGPALLAFTPHSIMAAGYHRNSDAMRDVMRAWIGDEATAKAFVDRRDIGLVVYCQGLPEMEVYLQKSPKGFLAQLEQGKVPAWLERLPVAGHKDLRVYRVKR